MRCRVANLDRLTSCDKPVVRSIVELGHSLGLETVAEGVENAEAFRELARTHCDQVQGFLFAKPMPADALVPWLRSAEALRQTA